MSQVEPGPTFKGGGSATITLGPADGSNVYQHQGLFLTATVRNGTTPIPTGAAIDFSSSNAGLSENFVQLPGEPKSKIVRIVPDAHDNTLGTATLAVRYDPIADKTGKHTITVNAKPAHWIGTPPGDATSVTYTVLMRDPTITCYGPSKTLLPIPPSNSDALTPQSDEYTTMFNCLVVDETLEHPTPIANYIVEWHEAAQFSLGLFADVLMNVYTSQSAVYTDRVQLGNPSLVKDTVQKGLYLRAQTNAQGVANLYLVARNKNGAIAQGVRAQYDFAETSELGRPLLVVDTTKTGRGLSGSHPKVKGIDPQTDTLDYDLLDAPFIETTVPAYPGAQDGDQVYLVVNGVIADGPEDASADTEWSWGTQFSETLGYTDDKTNEVLFVVSNVNSGMAAASQILKFKGKGDNDQGAIPTGGTLIAPDLYPPLAYINSLTLGNPSVIINITMDQSDTNGWKAEPGDVITAQAVLTGFMPNSDNRKPVVTLVSGPTNITVQNAGDTYLSMSFPTHPSFEGWDSRLDPPRKKGYCYFTYTVSRANVPDQTSKVGSVILDTANQD